MLNKLWNWFLHSSHLHTTRALFFRLFPEFLLQTTAHIFSTSSKMVLKWNELLIALQMPIEDTKVYGELPSLRVRGSKKRLELCNSPRIKHGTLPVAERERTVKLSGCSTESQNNSFLQISYSSRSMILSNDEVSMKPSFYSFHRHKSRVYRLHLLSRQLNSIHTQQID